MKKNIVGMIGICLLVLLSLGTNGASAWLSDYDYRTPIEIDCNTENLTDYQVQITLQGTNSSAANYVDFDKILTDGIDIRFTDSDKTTEIDFWIEEWDDTLATSTIWVEVAISGTATIYMYYGNHSASSASDGTNTFMILSEETVEEWTIDEWTPYENNPFSVDLTFASVVKVGSTYHAYYSFNMYIIYHATSTDGKNWTDDVANNPVLSTGAWGTWDYGSVLCSWVWVEDSIWYMIYHGRGEIGEPQAVGLATSVDGINWTKHASNPVFIGTEPWELNDVENWGVIKVNSTYYMWYESGVGCRASGEYGRTLGLATSTDLVNWTRDINNPIFPCLPSKCCPCCFKRGDYFYLVFRLEGVDPEEVSVYRDTKPTFYTADREFIGVAHFRPVGGWDGGGTDTPFVFTDDIYRNTYNGSNNELWMYYSGRSAPGNMFIEGMTIEPDIDAALTPFTHNITYTTYCGSFDDFENGVGSWIEDTVYNKGTVTQENNIVKIHSYSTKHSNPEGYSIFYYPFNNAWLTNKSTIEFYVRPAQTNTLLNFFATRYPSHDVSRVSAHIMFYSDGNIKYYDGTMHTIMAYSADTWYRIILSDINFSADTFDIWIDGVKKEDNIPFFSGNSEYSFDCFEMELSGAGTNYLDMLLLRESVSNESSATTTSAFSGYNKIFTDISNTVSATDYVSYSAEPTVSNLVDMIASPSDVVNITTTKLTTSASIILDGVGTTNLVVQMPNTAIAYTAKYDGNNCNNLNCSFTQSNGKLNFSLLLGSEHTLDIEAEPTILEKFADMTKTSMALMGILAIAVLAVLIIGVLLNIQSGAEIDWKTIMIGVVGLIAFLVVLFVGISIFSAFT